MEKFRNIDTFKSERLSEEDFQNYINFFYENISDLDVYSEEERIEFIKRRDINYLIEKTKEENRVFLVIKNNKGEIVASTEGVVLVDKITNKKFGLVSWIIVGKNSKKMSRQERMYLGVNISSALENLFLKMGCNVLRAEIKNKNSVSINLCKRFGFTESKLKHKKPDMKWYYKNIT
jgi:hypothetical protein